MNEHGGNRGGRAAGQNGHCGSNRRVRAERNVGLRHLPSGPVGLVHGWFTSGKTLRQCGAKERWTRRALRKLPGTLATEVGFGARVAR